MYIHLWFNYKEYIVIACVTKSNAYLNLIEY